MREVKLKNSSPIQLQITPSPSHDGFSLNSPTLLFPLWYPTFESALGYARFLGRESGCDVRVNNAEGRQIDLIQYRFRRGSSGERRGVNGHGGHGGHMASELQACNRELREQIASMTRLEWELLENNEREHRRFGWDLHEDLGQQLAGIAILASLLTRQIENNCPSLVGELGELVTQLRKAIMNTRNIARGLYPIGLENGGLSMVLEEFAAWITQVEGIPCEFRRRKPFSEEPNPAWGLGDSYSRTFLQNEMPKVCVGARLRLEEEFRLPKESAIHLYRIAQEAVNCLLKTGEVRRISIEASLVDSAPTLIVTGEGIAIGELSQEGAGLMYSRAKMIGAEIRFEKNSDRERKIVCSFNKLQEPVGA